MADWTHEQENRLRELWDDLANSTAMIGRTLGFSKNAVVGKSHRLDLPSRPSPIKRGEEPKSYPPQRAPKRTLPSLAAPVVVSPPKPKPKPKAVPKAAVPKPKPKAVPKPPAQPSRHPCSWPLGDPGIKGFRFCEAPAEFSKPYCAEHCRVAYQRHGHRHEDEEAAA